MFLTKQNKIKWNVLGIGFGVTLVLVLAGGLGFDKPVYLFMRGGDCGLWNIFDFVFDAKMWLLVSGIVTLAFYVKKSVESTPKFKSPKVKFNLNVFLYDFLQKTKTSYAFFIFCAVLGASVVTGVLKFLIGRERPYPQELVDFISYSYGEFLSVGNPIAFVPFSTDWTFNSMPSGHTATSFAGLVMFGLLVPRFKWLTWTLAVVVGASRVAVGAHWPSDVIFGAFIGMAMADIVKAILKSRNIIE